MRRRSFHGRVQDTDKRLSRSSIGHSIGGFTGRKDDRVGGGCFWCGSRLQELKGVKSVRSGYAGDSAATATIGLCAAAARTTPKPSKFVTMQADTLGQLLKIHFRWRTIPQPSIGKAMTWAANIDRRLLCR